MATWVPWLGAHAIDAAALAMKHEAGIHEGHPNTLCDFLNCSVFQESPDKFAPLILHLLKGTPRPLFASGALTAIINLIRSQGSYDLAEIIEQAMNIGYRPAEP